MSAPTRGKVQAALFYGCKPTRTTSLFAYKAAALVHSAHDRPQAPSLRSQKDGGRAMCCVLGVRAARPWAEYTVGCAAGSTVHTQSTDSVAALRPMPEPGVVHQECTKSACCRTAFRALAAFPQLVLIKTGPHRLFCS
jgi:hypothetical protein